MVSRGEGRLNPFLPGEDRLLLLSGESVFRAVPGSSGPGGVRFVRREWPFFLPIFEPVATAVRPSLRRGVGSAPREAHDASMALVAGRGARLIRPVAVGPKDGRKGPDGSSHQGFFRINAVGSSDSRSPCGCEATVSALGAPRDRLFPRRFCPSIGRRDFCLRFTPWPSSSSTPRPFIFDLS